MVLDFSDVRLFPLIKHWRSESQTHFPLPLYTSIHVLTRHVGLISEGHISFGHNMWSGINRPG